MFNIAKLLALVCKAAQPRNGIVLEALKTGKLSLAKHAIEHRERRKRAELFLANYSYAIKNQRKARNAPSRGLWVP